MNMRTLVACLLLAGTSAASGQETTEWAPTFDGDALPSKACVDGDNDTDCVIELKVEDRGSDSCLITLLVPTQDLVTFVKGFKDKFIYWKIKLQQGEKPYRFGRQDGIAFVYDPRPRSFVGLVRGNKDPTTFRAKNKFTRTSVFKYAINVTNETSDAPATRECTLDPWFRNR